jgi:hypothetical protein
VRRIIAAARRALREPPARTDVHFHNGPHGPAPCYDPGCPRPRLA